MDHRPPFGEARVWEGRLIASPVSTGWESGLRRRGELGSPMFPTPCYLGLRRRGELGSPMFPTPCYLGLRRRGELGSPMFPTPCYLGLRRRGRYLVYLCIFSGEEGDNVRTLATGDEPVVRLATNPESEDRPSRLVGIPVPRWRRSTRAHKGRTPTRSSKRKCEYTESTCGLC